MEATAEGLAKAAATRETLRTKKRELEEAAKTDGAPKAKRPATAPPPAPCTHEVLFPRDFDQQDKLDLDTYGTYAAPHYNGPSAKEYPFTLDSFQAIAVACVERNEDVLVAAHTSAGKTAVAEYAIAKAFSKNQRVFYTSPIKALSNQKFRELSEEFTDVGLMTGDVSINPEAACIVMTTEILRSMIYRGSELLRECAWIIFDEVHYMQDRERGVIWEETIIFAPKEARMVFLSATLSNASEFAEWVASVHHTPCHVVYTEYRPTPLRHYAYPAGGDGLYLILNEFGQFRDDNFRKLQAVLTGDNDKPGEKTRRKRTDGENSGDLRKIIKLIKDRKYDPVVVFSFSRRECEANAMLITSEKLGVLDFNTDAEKEAVDLVFKNALDCLPQRDQELRAVAHIFPLLRCGIGIHHSGLLPIIKEVVEVLFQEQLIKCLFATETFAMGLNMPARTVVFTAMRKWDGREERWLGSGEYIQMSGRAGRRGKDDRGMTIMMLNKKLDEETCKAIVKGKANPLVSSFRLSYYTLLNLFRRAEGVGADMEYVIRHSFSQFQHDKEMPALETRLQELEKEVEATGEASDAVVEEYRSLTERVTAADAAIAAAIRQPDRCLHYLRPGRLIRVRQAGVDWGWGVVVSALRLDKGTSATGGDGTLPAAVSSYQLDVLLCCAGVRDGEPLPGTLDDDATTMEVVPVPLALLHAIGTLRISIPQDLRSAEARRAVLVTLRALSTRYKASDLPLLDPAADMKIVDPAVSAATDDRTAALSALDQNAIYRAEHGVGQDAEALEPLKRKAQLLAEIETVRGQMRVSQLASFKEEAKSRSAVLRKLGHLSDENVVTTKGRVACEISTADELLATELMMNGTFNRLDKHQLVAMVSCLIQVEKSNEEIKLKEVLATPLRALQDAARHIAEVSIECKLEIDTEDYVTSFWPYLMDVMYAWSKGATFGEICEMTDLFEGSIVRATRRLDELMSELERAALAVGDSALAQRIDESRSTIRRDIMFAASLYI